MFAKYYARTEMSSRFYKWKSRFLGIESRIIKICRYRTVRQICEMLLLEQDSKQKISLVTLLRKCLKSIYLTEADGMCGKLTGLAA
jgi:hypothetical protein